MPSDKRTAALLIVWVLARQRGRNTSPCHRGVPAGRRLPRPLRRRGLAGTPTAHPAADSAGTPQRGLRPRYTGRPLRPADTRRDSGVAAVAASVTDGVPERRGSGASANGSRTAASGAGSSPAARGGSRRRPHRLAGRGGARFHADGDRPQSAVPATVAAEEIDPQNAAETNTRQGTPASGGAGTVQPPPERSSYSYRCAALIATLVIVVFVQAIQGQVVARRPTSSLVFLVDVSGSMGNVIGNGNPEIKIAAAKEAASAAVRRAVQRGTVEVAVLAFEGACAQPVPRYVDFTTDFGVLDRFISSLRPGGDTPMAPALLFANRFMKNEGASTARDQMIVLLADGENNCGSVADAMAELKSSGVIFRHETIGFGITANSGAARDLRDIATASGGMYHHATNATQLGDLFEEFIDTFTVMDLLGTFRRPGTSGSGVGIQPSAAPSQTAGQASSSGTAAQLTELLGRFGQGEQRQATEGPKEYFIAVAANSIGDQAHTLRLAWGFGYHSDSGNEAGLEARRACNAQGRGGCANLGIPSMRGGCAAVAQGSWIERGRAPQVRLHAGTSSLGRGAAEEAAMTRCGMFTGAGLAPDTLLQSDCVPLAVVCSSDVGR